MVDACIRSLQTRSIERLYPLSAFQWAIYQDIVNSLAQPQRSLDQSAGHVSSSSDWAKYHVHLGKPGTGKSQVVIRAIHHALQQEYAVLLPAPVALLAQGYKAIFGQDLEAETLHAAFHIPVDPQQTGDVNFELNRFDMVVVDKTSLVSLQTFGIMASTLNRLNSRPAIVIAGDKYQQQPLQTVDSRVTTTVSILNNNTFTAQNSVKHALY